MLCSPRPRLAPSSCSDAPWRTGGPQPEGDGWLPRHLSGKTARPPSEVLGMRCASQARRTPRSEAGPKSLAEGLEALQVPQHRSRPFTHSPAPRQQPGLSIVTGANLGVCIKATCSAVHNNLVKAVLRRHKGDGPREGGGQQQDPASIPLYVPGPPVSPHHLSPTSRPGISCFPTPPLPLLGPHLLVLFAIPLNDTTTSHRLDPHRRL